MIVVALLLACQPQQYIGIPDAEVIAGTPQYAYSNVWVGPTAPTFVVTAGDLELEPDSSVTLEIDVSGAFGFEVTEIVFLGLETGDTDFGSHWRYPLDADELLARKAVINIHSLTYKPPKPWCTVKHVGTWTCFQGARLGVDGLGLSAAGSDSVSIYTEVPVSIPRLGGSSEPGECAAYTVDDCCAGAPGIEAIECAWDPVCECPSGTTDLGFYGDGYRRCDCPG